MNITWGHCFWNTGNRKRLGTGWMTWRIVFNTLQNEKKLHHTGSENTVRLKFLKYHMIKCSINWNPQCLLVLDLHVFTSLCEWLHKLEVICIKKQEFIKLCMFFLVGYDFRCFQLSIMFVTYDNFVHVHCRYWLS